MSLYRLVLRPSLALTVVLLAGVVSSTIVACDDQPIATATTKRPSSDDDDDDDDDDDASNGDDDTADDDASTPVSKTCPKPPVITPETVPGNGFLAPITVTLKFVVDGDTAHFGYPNGVETIVRFLYVNTEESHGKETTPYGVETADKVKAIFAAGKSFVVVPEEGSTPGTPHLDPYDRTLALVFVDGTLFQTRLVAEGLSAYYTVFGCAQSPIHQSLLYSEAAAYENKIGIWKDDHPTNYAVVLKQWIGTKTCRPNPYTAPYCP